MANTLTANIGAVWNSTVQEFLLNRLVGKAVSNVRFMSNKDGNTLHFPYIPQPRSQAYVPGTDLTIDAISSTDNTLVVNQMAASTFSVNPVQESQVTTDWIPRAADGATYALANQIDQYVLNKGVTLASTTTAGGTLSTSNIYSTLSQAKATLMGLNAYGTHFVVMDHNRAALIEQAALANGFNLADSVYVNGYTNASAGGLKVYVSNNLPAAVTLTLAVQPTAADTITVKGVTWTWVAASTAAAAGEISIGANLAAAKVNFVAAINGTGTPGTNTYIDISGELRRRFYTNQQLSAATFSADTCALTAYGMITPSKSFASASNLFGTETSQMLAGVEGAISMGISKSISTIITQEPKQTTKNYITTCFYDATVFYMDRYQLLKITHNA